MLPREGELQAVTAPEAELHEVQRVVRRVLAARIRDPYDLEDLVQETLARTMSTRERVVGPLEAYAVTTAKNLVAERARRDDRYRRLAPRLAVPVYAEPLPLEELIGAESRTHVARALGHLPDDERHLLLAHEVEGRSTAELAEESGSTPGAVAARLARARAVLRVEYLLVRDHVEPPTGNCRRVLLAVSRGERRRLDAVDADSHLLRCDTCSRLAHELRYARPGPADGSVRVPIARDADVVTARQRAREVAAELGFAATELTLVATAVSELARNVVRFAEHGEAVITRAEAPGRIGIQVVVRDSGPGIPDVQTALQDGYSTYAGLGLGLPGARRLVDELDVVSEPGVGVTVTMTTWRAAGAPGGSVRR